ncbi:MAG TPA: Hsp20 family protein [Bryobacteraceae bacterium]|nr:Hsp20 family protein [Bryobacteraceae bacterium]
MPEIMIEKNKESGANSPALLAALQETTDAIRLRAYQYYLQRGAIHGRDQEDWLRAERDTILSPVAELTEDEKDFHLRIEAPLFGPGDIRVTAAPRLLLVRGDLFHNHAEPSGKLWFCEFAEKLFRRFDFPVDIEPDQVSATLQQGILEIIAPKANVTATPAVGVGKEEVVVP